MNKLSEIGNQLYKSWRERKLDHTKITAAQEELKRSLSRTGYSNRFNASMAYSRLSRIYENAGLLAEAARFRAYNNRLESFERNELMVDKQFYNVGLYTHTQRLQDLAKGVAIEPHDRTAREAGVRIKDASLEDVYNELYTSDATRTRELYTRAANRTMNRAEYKEISRNYRRK